MAAGTLKDFLIGIGFNVDTAGSAKAEKVLGDITTLVHQLGQVLTEAGTQIKGLVDGAVGGTDALKGHAGALGEVAGNASKASSSLGMANKAAQMHGAKQGSKNVQLLDMAMHKATSTIKRYGKMLLAAIAGNSIKNAFKQAFELMNNLEQSSKKLKKSIEETRAYDTALKVMGKTAQEIKANGSLKETFETLESLGEKIALPEAAQGVTGIRNIISEFTQLKFVANYAMQWILYKVQTVAEGPLAEMRDIISGMKNWFAGNIEKIATFIATVMGHAVQLFNSLIETIQDVISWIDKLPGPIKTVGAVVATVIGAIKSKTFLITLIIGGILLLLDDLQTYLQGGKSMFGDFWGACQTAVEVLRPIVEGFIEYFAAGIETIWGWVTTLADALGTDVVAAIGAVVAAFFLLKANPIVLIIAAISALVAAIGWLSRNWDKVRAKAEEVWAAIKTAVINAWNAVVEAWSGVVAWFAKIWEGIKSRAVSAWNSIKTRVTSIWDSITNVWGDAVAWFKGIWDGISSGARTVYSKVVGFFRSAWSKVKSAWNGVGDFFTGIWNTVKSTVTGLADSVAAWATEAWDTIKTTFQNVKTNVADWFSGIGAAVSGAVGDVSAWAKNAWSRITSFLRKVKDNVVAWFTGIGDSVAGAVGDVAAWAVNAWNTIVEKLEGIKETVTGWFRGIGEAVSSAVGNVASWASNAYSKIASKFSTIKDKVGSWFSGIGAKVDSVVGSVSGWATSAWETIKSTWEGVSGWFASIWETIEADPTLSTIASVLSAPFETAVAVISAIWDSVTGFFSSIWGLIKGDKSLADVFSSISAPFVNAYNTIFGIFNGIASKIAGWFDGIDLSAAVEGIKSWFSGLGEWFENLGITIANGLIDALNWIIRQYNSVAGIVSSDLQIGEISRLQTREEREAAEKAFNEKLQAGIEEHERQQREADKARVEAEIAAKKKNASRKTGGTEEEFAVTGSDDFVTTLEKYKSVIRADMEARANGGPLTNKNFDAKEAAKEYMSQFADGMYEGNAFAEGQLEAAVRQIMIDINEAWAASLTETKDSTNEMQESIDELDGSAAAENIDAAATDIESSMAEGESAVKSAVQGITQAIQSIPSAAHVSISADWSLRRAFSTGGKVTEETQATIGEDGPEYVIPISKPGRAMSLLRQAAADLGMTLSSARNAAAMMGGSPMGNTTPAYAVAGANGGGGAGAVTNNYNTINSPVTQNINGTNDRMIADMASKDYERVVLRNIKNALA